MYATIKAIHVGAALLSVSLFFLRGVRRWRGLPLRTWWFRTFPHLVDTVLLASALMLAWLSQQYPLLQPWLTAKVLALLAYIVIGRMAIKATGTRSRQLLALAVALGVFGYIVAVAVTKQVEPWG